MAYYPKSQIKTNLYTNGEELVYKTTLEQYIGFYYKVSNGRFYTGKNPNDGVPLELIIFTPTLLDNAEEPLLTSLPFNSEIIQIIKPVNDVPSQPDGIPYPTGVNSKSYPIKIIPRALPIFSITRPTNDDYNRGVYTKYFCKKNNELIYIEINKDTYNKLISNDPEIAWDLYTPTKIVFQIGNSDANMNTIKLIEQNLKWYGFSQYFKGNFES
jgi:hypothetical protein